MERNRGNCCRVFAACGGWQRTSKMRCGNRPGGLKCEFSLNGIFKKSRKPGGNRGAEEERTHAETQIARVERRKLC